VTQDAEPDFRKPIVARRIELEVEQAKLSQQIQVVRGELEELSVTVRVLHRLVDDEGCSESVA
jgi:hypothetical protein